MNAKIPPKSTNTTDTWIALRERVVPEFKKDVNKGVIPTGKFIKLPDAWNCISTPLPKIPEDISTFLSEPSNVSSSVKDPMELMSALYQAENKGVFLGELHGDPTLYNMLLSPGNGFRTKLEEFAKKDNLKRIYIEDDVSKQPLIDEYLNLSTTEKRRLEIQSKTSLQSNTKRWELIEEARRLGLEVICCDSFQNLPELPSNIQSGIDPDTALLLRRDAFAEQIISNKETKSEGKYLRIGGFTHGGVIEPSIKFMPKVKLKNGKILDYGQAWNHDYRSLNYSQVPNFNFSKLGRIPQGNQLPGTFRYFNYVLEGDDAKGLEYAE